MAKGPGKRSTKTAIGLHRGDAWHVPPRVANTGEHAVAQALRLRFAALVEALALQDYEKAHLPGALHLPKDQVDERAPGTFAGQVG